MDGIVFRKRFGSPTSGLEQLGGATHSSRLEENFFLGH
jgi:hypothetical protein